MTSPAAITFSLSGTDDAFRYDNPGARPAGRVHRRPMPARRRTALADVIVGPWPTTVSNAPLAEDMSYEDDGTDDHVRAYISRLWADDWDNPEDALYDNM